MSCITYPVVLIRNGGACLCSELIQTVEDRNICWVRPLVLILDETHTTKRSPIDVRNGPDVICPAPLVEPALDIEWVSVLQNLDKTAMPCDFSQANQNLRVFLKDLWPLEHPEV
ncbi:MAG: hypothetical protein AAFX01_04450 [Cyanobacteria bacterium J06638_28]